MALACLLAFGQLATLSVAAAPPYEQSPALSALPTSVEVPIRLTRTGHLLVPVLLDGDELPFMLDTGAGRSIISTDTYKKLKDKLVNKRPLRVQGVGGGMSASLVDLPNFSVGRYRRENMSAIVLDLKTLQERTGERFAGILGMDFLKNFDARVDLETKTLRLYACDERSDALSLVGREPLERVRFRGHYGLIMITVRLDGAVITGLFDTGAERTIMNWAAARAAGVTPETRGVRKENSRYVGVDNNPLDLFRYQFKQFEVGEARYSPAKISIADLPVFETLGMKQQPAMIIGADFLKDRVLFIAQSSGHVFLSRDAEGAAGELAVNAGAKSDR